jgi:outer membrane lipoprotein-sorting protein
MKKRISGILFLLFCFTFVQGANPKKIVKKFIKYYEKANFIEIQYEQKMVLSLTNTISSKKGTIIFSNKSNLFRMEDDDQIMSLDGKNFYRLNKNTNQLTIDYVKKSDQMFFFQKLFRDADKHFYIILLEEKKIKKDKLYVLKLTPKEDENQLFKEVKIWLTEKSKKILKVQMIDLNDNETTYLISRLKILSQVKPELFKIEPTEEMEVIDLRL